MSQNINNLSAAEKTLLRLLAKGLPLDPRPFQIIAELSGTTEEHVIETLKKLKNQGSLRGLQATFSPQKCGLFSTLVALAVPEEKLNTVAQEINRLPQVSHNYQRSHRFNLWFTFVAEHEQALQSLLQTLKAKFGIEDALNLPASEFYKLDVSSFWDNAL